MKKNSIMKKKYIQPGMSVLQIEPLSVLAASATIGKASDKGYREDVYKDMWGNPDDKTIWAD